MIRKSIIDRVINQALSNGADFAEIFAENTYSSTLNMNKSVIKQSIVGNDYGAGLRVFYGNSAIYAYTNDLSEDSLMKVAGAISKAQSSDTVIKPVEVEKKDVSSIHKYLVKNDDVSKEEKIDILTRADKAARSYNSLITEVDIRMMERMQRVLIANSEGLLKEDERYYSRLYTTAIAEKNGEKQTGTDGPGSLQGFEFFRNLDVDSVGIEAARIAVTMINADYAPGGTFPVIIDNGFGGVIFHEACGHALETTSVAKGASVFADKLNQKIAHEAVTAIDDGTMPNTWGSIAIDDEGTPTQKTVLIENGILKSFMIDKLGGRKIGMTSTGSGRRQSYKFAPTSRMRNTFLAPGKYKLEDLIATVDFGIYAKKMGGGSVMPGTGNYNFSVAEGYIIRNGKIMEPVRGATLIGNGAETLHKISMVADNLALAPGMCGSVSGSVPTTVGQPAIRVDEIIVGGRKEQ